jgi:murein DD-endopeptidase MepM/ murein hydrolase activator NlpD
MAKRKNPLQLIWQFAPLFDLDPRAVAAVARHEGGWNWGAVGDQGTSFGPFQLHEGGALPAGRGAAWANSPAGIKYAMRQMAKTAAGLKGQAAIRAIVRDFERPANIPGQIAKSLNTYRTFNWDSINTQSPGPMARNDRPEAVFGDNKSAKQQLLAAIQQNLQLVQQKQMPDNIGLMKAFMAMEADKVSNPQAGGNTQSAKANLMAGLLGGKFQWGGGPDAHGSRALGDWQSDRAWDLMAKPGTPVYAPRNAKVQKVRRSDNGKTVWGYQVTLGGKGGPIFLTHLGKLAPGLKPGAKLRQGDLIGYIGDAPYFDPHLHIGLQRGDIRDFKL